MLQEIAPLVRRYDFVPRWSDFLSPLLTPFVRCSYLLNLAGAFLIVMSINRVLWQERNGE